METTKGIALFFDPIDKKVRSGLVVKQFEADNAGLFFVVDFGNGEREVIPAEDAVLDPEHFEPPRTERLSYRRGESERDGMQRLIDDLRALEENEHEAEALYEEWNAKQREAACYDLAATTAVAGSIALGICAIVVMKDHSMAWGLFGVALSFSGFVLAAGLRRAAR